MKATGTVFFSFTLRRLWCLKYFYGSLHKKAASILEHLLYNMVFRYWFPYSLSSLRKHYGVQLINQRGGLSTMGYKWTNHMAEFASRWRFDVKQSSHLISSFVPRGTSSYSMIGYVP